MRIVHRVWLRVSAVFAALIAILFFLGTPVYQAKADTSAGSSLTNYDSTSIMDDLKDLDITDFPAIAKGTPQVISFMEYCYSTYALYKDYYGLYFYVYNPTEKAISATGNRANMAISYDEKGEPNGYQSVELTLLDTTTDKLSNRFFKFKVTNSLSFFDKATSYANAFKEERRYDIGGIQLNWKDTSAGYKMDYTYGKTYWFKGYSKGLSPDTETAGTLTSRTGSLETIELEVQHTNYRTEDYVDNVCDELNTVYFSVPSKYFEKYGEKLQKIKATWEEYKTSPIFVTNEEAAANALKEYRGVDVVDGNDGLDYRVLWDMQTVGVSSSTATAQYGFNWAYNRFTGNSTYASLGGNTYFWTDNSLYPLLGDLEFNDLERMAWIFYRKNAVLDGGEVTPNDWCVTATEMETYMKEVSNELAVLGENNVSKYNYLSYLFDESIDEDRLQYLDENNDGDNQTATRGRITQEFDAGDDNTFLLEKDQSWWDTLWHGVELDDEHYSPIHVFKSIEELSGMSATEFGKKYYVNENDAQKVLDYCRGQLNIGNKPVLFRFAKTEYYASLAYFDAESNSSFTSCDGYVAQETMFLDFDLISLTFKDKEGVQTVIPVVSDPIDIINGTTPPSGIPTDSGGCFEFNWDSIVSILVSIALLILGGWLLITLGTWLIAGGIKLVLSWIVGIIKWLCKLLFNGIVWLCKGFGYVVKYLFMAVVWIICLPFRVIGWLFRGSKNEKR